MRLVLVTGATGFVGRHLCRHLVERGDRVRGAVRRSPPADFPVAMEWVQVGPIGASTDWSAALEEVDFVVHLAAHAHQMGAPDSVQRPIFDEVNEAGTRVLATAIRAAPGVQRLVFVSSAGAVRTSAPDVLTATTPCEPEGAYAQSKRAAELAVQAALADASADWCILRPPLVYGPGNPGNMARLLRLVERGLPLPLAHIRNRRSFVYVGNLVAAIELCLTHAGASRQAFFVSDGDDLSTPVLVRRLSKYARRPARLFPVPAPLLGAAARVGDLFARLAGRSIGLDTYSLQRLTDSLALDVSLLCERTGWRPPYTVDEGLAATLHRSQA
jgi:nucleoside-diphosphate-sugar epimerase